MFNNLYLDMFMSYLSKHRIFCNRTQKLYFKYFLDRLMFLYHSFFLVIILQANIIMFHCNKLQMNTTYLNFKSKWDLGFYWIQTLVLYMVSQNSCNWLPVLAVSLLQRNGKQTWEQNRLYCCNSLNLTQLLWANGTCLIFGAGPIRLPVAPLCVSELHRL